MANFLLNPGFETGTPGNPDNWYTYVSGGTGQTFTYPVAGRIGGSSVEVTYAAANGFAAIWGQNVNVVSNTTYRLSGYMKTQDVVGGGVGGAKMSIDWFDASNVYISTSDLIPYPWISGTTDWTIYQGNITTPVNAVTGHIIIGIQNCSGSAYFDDMFFDTAGGISCWLKV